MGGGGTQTKLPLDEPEARHGPKNFSFTLRSVYVECSSDILADGPVAVAITPSRSRARSRFETRHVGLVALAPTLASGHLAAINGPDARVPLLFAKHNTVFLNPLGHGRHFMSLNAHRQFRRQRDIPRRKTCARPKGYPISGGCRHGAKSAPSIWALTQHLLFKCSSSSLSQLHSRRRKQIFGSVHRPRTCSVGFAALTRSLRPPQGHSLRVPCLIFISFPRKCKVVFH